MPRVSLIVVILLKSVNWMIVLQLNTSSSDRKNHRLNFPLSKILTLIRLVRICRIKNKERVCAIKYLRNRRKNIKIFFRYWIIFVSFWGIIMIVRSLSAHLWEITIFSVAISLFRRIFGVFEDGINISATNIIHFN